MSNALEKRISRLESELERRGLAHRPRRLTQFDEDALAIYNSTSYLDATTSLRANDIEDTVVYRRGRELRDALYGPIIPLHLNEHIKRYTRTSGEFELAFGREPKAGDILRYKHLESTHSSENYSRVFGRAVEAWQRQLPQQICPLRFEEGRLFRRLAAERRDAEPGVRPELVGTETQRHRLAEAQKARVLGRSRAMEKPLGTWFRQWLIVHKITALDGLSGTTIESHGVTTRSVRKSGNVLTCL
jgi:hypothetical protein